MSGDDEYSNAELSRAVQRIEADVHEIKTDVKAQAAIYATKEYVAEVKDSLGREIRDIRVDQQRMEDSQRRLEESKRIPWPHIVSALVATIAFAVALMQIIAHN
jgi:hypothetical protein